MYIYNVQCTYMCYLWFTLRFPLACWPLGSWFGQTIVQRCGPGPSWYHPRPDELWKKKKISNQWWTHTHHYCGNSKHAVWIKESTVILIRLYMHVQAHSSFVSKQFLHQVLVGKLCVAIPNTNDYWATMIKRHLVHIHVRTCSRILIDVACTVHVTPRKTHPPTMS